MADATTLTCTNCKQALFEELARSEPPQHCPHCNHQLRLALFPAWFRAGSGASTTGTSRAVVSDEAGCFFHERKLAVTTCDECGRFICSLCDLEIAGQHLCPRCLESGSRRGSIVDLERQRIRYDQLAVSLAAFSLLFFFLSPILAGAGIFIVLWKWKSPPSRLINSRAVAVTALVLLVLEFVGGLALWYTGFKGV